VGKLPAMGQPKVNSAFHPFGVDKWVVIHVITWMARVETIKRQSMATHSCIWLQAKVRELGLGCGLGCTPSLSVTHSAHAAVVCSPLRYTFVTSHNVLFRFDNVNVTDTVILFATATYSVIRRDTANIININEWTDRKSGRSFAV